ncbi:caspase family protein [Candidatus Pacearchaeota archaeon]|jgi:hypothetical protein|nr:caspase family protein [Candidatus Pacearchaeota archaeon]
MTRKALIVGVNAYQTPYQLRSCLNDATDLQTTLQNKRGFAQFATLLDGAATRSAILAQLQSLVSNAVSGDSIMFAFFGHGTPGSGICPVDIDPNTGTNVIWDYELGNILSQMPAGVTCDVLLGCCYSGGGTRSSLPSQGGKIDTKFKEKLPKASKLIKIEPMTFPVQPAKTSIPVAGLNHCLFAASTGSAYECISGGLYRGLHTVWWCYVVRNALTWTRSQIDAYVTTKVHLTAPTQNPVVEGTSTELAQQPFA